MHRPPFPRRRPAVPLLIVAGLLLAACGGGGGGSSTSKSTATSATDKTTDASVTAQVASYELVAGRDQRFIIGVVGGGESGLLAFGQIDLAFSFLGTKEKPVQPPAPGPKVSASFRPLPGQKIDPATPGPKLVEPSKGVGVYGAEAVRFDQPGFWQVDVAATVAGRPRTATARFEVRSAPRLPFPGDPAPRTQNPLPGAPDVSLAAIDSRARGGEPIPDPELHSVSIADSIEQGRPVLVTISTPVYCQSRFCGPITDAVQGLAHKYAGKLDFVHLEVWQDFQAQKVNPFVRDWIVPKDGNGGANEPWTYLVGRDGRIAARWDNVATEAEMEAAIAKL